eukprot:4971000-Heterocapsa_arctica.AAC.1
MTQCLESFMVSVFTKAAAALRSADSGVAGTRSPAAACCARSTSMAVVFDVRRSKYEVTSA